MGLLKKSSILARRWDALRFKLSCLMYKSPLSFSLAMLSLGLLLGVVALSTLNHSEGFFSSRLLANTDGARSSYSEPDPRLMELSLHLSTLQTQANRLDGLGEKWVKRMGLEQEPFDFSIPPGQGDGDEGGYVEFSDSLDPDALVDDAALLALRYQRLETQLSVLEDLLRIDEKFPEDIPHASPGYGHMTSSFGTRHDPFGRGRRFHSGIDFSARLGDPVMAMAAGEVVYSGRRGGYGQLVEIDHGNGYKTRYAHNSSLLVKLGDQVQVGQVIAKAGSTGRSTGVHLHVEVWKDGVAINPRPFLERGRQLHEQRQRVLAALENLPRVEKNAMNRAGFYTPVSSARS